MKRKIGRLTPGASRFDEYWPNFQQFPESHHAGANADDAFGRSDDYFPAIPASVCDFHPCRRIGRIDGFIAKNFDLRTELGAYLDPLADKALLISIYVSLAIYAGLPAWIAVTVVSRDVMILMAVLVSWLLDKPVEIRPGLGVEVQYGRADRACRLRARRSRVRSSILNLRRPPSNGRSLATTLASGGVYIAQWLDHMSR